MRTIIGALGLAVVFSASAEGSMNNVTSLSAAGGRYAFGQVSSQRVDQYLLDTQTGRLWRGVCLSGEAGIYCKSIAFQPITFIDANGNVAGLAPGPEPAATQQKR